MNTAKVLRTRRLHASRGTTDDELTNDFGGGDLWVKVFMSDQAASNIPTSGNRLHVRRPVNLTKDRLKRKNQRTVKTRQTLLGTPTI